MFNKNWRQKIIENELSEFKSMDYDTQKKEDNIYFWLRFGLANVIKDY